MIQLNYRDSKPIYEQIKDGLRKLVISKTAIGPGTCGEACNQPEHDPESIPGFGK